MKKIKAIIKDEYTLELLEDAYKGDLIDLKELMDVDTSLIRKLIENNKDEVYKELVSRKTKELNLEFNNKLLEEKSKTDKTIQDLLNEIKSLKENQENAIKENTYKLEKKYQDEINQLKSNIENIKHNNELNIKESQNKQEKVINELQNQVTIKIKEIEMLNKTFEQRQNVKAMEVKEELSNKYSKELEELRTKYETLKNTSESDTKVKVLEKENELNTKYQKEIEQYKKELESEKLENENLRQQKSRMNIKQIGNNLEDWCDDRITELTQNGLRNCTWRPDHELVKDEDSENKSKADFIFKVFADDTCNPEQEIASICFDMKDEDPYSVNKQTNEHYYKTLDKNRKKKNCKYAVLVSNLELDRTDPLPIFKVRQYEDMYVVRPAYLTSFINMVVSLSTRYQELILKNETEVVQLKKQKEILEEFNKIKNTYLDKPLEGLKSKVNTISEQTEAIKKANNKIKETCDKIVDDYIENIIKKISNFELKVNKIID